MNFSLIYGFEIYCSIVAEGSHINLHKIVHEMLVGAWTLLLSFSTEPTAVVFITDVQQYDVRYKSLLRYFH